MLFKKKASTALIPRETLAAAKTSPSFLAAELTVVGTIVSTGTVVVDGRIKGPCCAARFTVGENGNVQGNVVASEIVICGRIEGDLKAATVQLRAHSAIDGGVRYRTLSVEAGGLLNGDCRYADDPFADIAGPIREKMARLASGIPAQAKRIS